MLKLLGVLEEVNNAKFSVLSKLKLYFFGLLPWYDVELDSL